MSTRLLTGIFFKTKISSNLNKFSTSSVACYQNILATCFITTKFSCNESTLLHMQRRCISKSTAFTSQATLNNLYSKNSELFSNGIATNFIADNRYFSNNKNNKTDSIPGLSIKSSSFSIQAKDSLNDSSKESAKSEGDSKDKAKETWYSGKNAWKVGLACLAISAVSGLSGFIFTFGAPPVDADGKAIEDEFTDMNPMLGYLKRASKEMRVMKKMIQDPSSEKLLPDVLKEPWFQPPFTLVIEMTGILVHPDWTLSTGWRFKKRPGLSYFLQNVGPPLFEIVIYTHEQGFTAYPIIDSMDPEGRVMYRLFRDATKYSNGAHVKDLSFLNRDLSKVIMVDCDPKAMSLQPRNGLLIKKWNGEDSDRSLIDLANFLKTIALSEVEDVRSVMEYYSQFDDPLAVFKDKQKQLQQFEEEKDKLAHGNKNKSFLRSGLSRKF